MLPMASYMIGFEPVSKTNGATASTLLPIDLMGYDYCDIVVFGGTSDVVSDTLSVLKLTEADDTAATSFGNVSGAVGGTDFTIATNAYTSTTNHNIWVLRVDCKARKRYLKVLASPQTTQVIAAIAIRQKAEQAPITAAKANVLNIVNV